MRVRNLRSSFERLRGFFEVFQLGVVDEPEIVIKAPVVWVVLNAIFHEPDRAIWLTSASGRGGSEEGGSELIGRQQLRIKGRGNFEQRPQFVVAGFAQEMAMPKILNCTCPINARHEPVESQACAFHELWRG